MTEAQARTIAHLQVSGWYAAYLHRDDSLEATGPKFWVDALTPKILAGDETGSRQILESFLKAPETVADLLQDFQRDHGVPGGGVTLDEVNAQIKAELLKAVNAL